ncbi:MAG: hypothetical protein ABI438_10680 [Dermatophilaceae bacterium]
MNRSGLQVVAGMLLGAAVIGFGHTPWWVGGCVSTAAVLVMWLIDYFIGRTAGRDVGESDTDHPSGPDLRYVRRR